MAEKAAGSRTSPAHRGEPAANEQQDKVVSVHSELAEPSRPGGYDGTRLAILEDGPTHPGEGPPDDAELARLVRLALKSDGRTAHCNIDVSVRGGVADLTGVVELEFERILAVALAEAVPGVLNVADHLKVETY